MVVGLVLAAIMLLLGVVTVILLATDLSHVLGERRRDRQRRATALELDSRSNRRRRC